MKKNLARFLAVLLLVCIGASCAYAESYVAPEMTTVTIALFDDANALSVWDKLAEVINENLAAQNIRLEVLQIPSDGWVQYYQKVMAMQAAGTAPDIGRIAEFYLPMLIKKNQVADLTDRISELDMSKYFESAFKGAAYQDGHTYGVPSGMYTVVMYYNKDLFDAAGLSYPSSDWENPTPMSEIVEMSAKLTSGSGANKTYGFACHTAILHLNHFLKGNGGIGLYDENGKAMMSSDPLNTEIYNDFYKMSVEDKSMVTTSDSEIITAAELFHQGRLAMYVDGTWNQARFKTITDFTPGIAYGTSTSFLDQYVIYNGSKNKDAAWEVIKQIMGETCQTIIAENSLYGVTVTRDVLDSSLNELVGDVFSAEDVDTYYKSIDKMQAAPYTLAYSEVSPKTVAILTQMMLGNVNGEEAAKMLDETLDAANAEEY